MINTLYLISHTHTDIGYTDYQSTIFRQHFEFIDQAIERADIQIKRVADGRGLILHAFNLTAQAQDISIRFPISPTGARACSPIEEDGQALSITGETIPLHVPSRSLGCARVIFQ
jgi:hypothetical protein